MKTITALELRKKLGSVLNEVAQKSEQVTISRANKPLAVLISVKDYEEKVLGKNRERTLRQVAVKMDEWKKQHRRETARIDVVRAVRDLRAAR